MEKKKSHEQIFLKIAHWKEAEIGTKRVENSREIRVVEHKNYDNLLFSPGFKQKKI